MQLSPTSLRSVSSHFVFDIPFTFSFKIGDLVGTSLLAGAFVLLEVLGDQSLAKLPAHGHADHHDIAHNITEVVTTTLEGLVHL